MIGAAASASAQQTAPQQVVPRVEVTASPGAYDPRRDDTAAKFVVTSEELAKYGDTSVVDALKRVPGVTVTSTGRGADVKMRGLGAGYTQILVNGEPAPAGFSIDALAPAQIERIEVMRSATAELSTQSIAGTINIVLRKTSRRPQRQVQLGYGGDSTERTPRATFLLSDRSDNLSYSLSGYFRQSSLERTRFITDSERDLAGQGGFERRIDWDDVGRFRTISIVPRLTWTLENGDTLSIESIVGTTRYHFDGDQATTSIVGTAPPLFDLDSRARARSANARTDLVWNSKPGQDAKLEVKIGAQGARGENHSIRDRSGHGVLLHNAIDVDTRERGFNSSAKYQRKLGEAHQLSMGLEGSRLVRRESNDELNSHSQDAQPIRELAHLYGRTIQAAAFAQDEWAVTPLWSVYLGLRGERIAVTTDSSSRARSASTVWSPIFQTLVKFPGSPNDQIRLALTRTFKAPEMENLLPRRRRYELNAPTNPDLEGNPALQPELAKGVDLTYEHYFAKNALVSAGISTRRIDHYTLTQVSYGADGRWVGRPVNAGQAKMHALELEAKLPLTVFGPKLPAVEVRANLNRNWSSVEQVPGPGNRMAQQVPLSASLGADYVRGSLTTGASLAFSRGAWTRTTAMQRVQTWNRRDADLYALWKFDAARLLRVTVANLLGDDTYTGSEYVDGGVSRRSVVTPGQVSVRALFELKF